MNGTWQSTSRQVARSSSTCDIAEPAAHRDDARHAFGEGALARRMNLRDAGHGRIELRRRGERLGIRHPLLRRHETHESGAIGVLSLVAARETAVRERRVQLAHGRRTFGQRYRRRRIHGLRQALFEHARHRVTQHVPGRDGRCERARDRAQALAMRRVRDVEQREHVDQQRQARRRRKLRDARDLRLRFLEELDAEHRRELRELRAPFRGLCSRASSRRTPPARPRPIARFER